jgi:hypothetical protein
MNNTFLPVIKNSAQVSIAPETNSREMEKIFTSAYMPVKIFVVQENLPAPKPGIIVNDETESQKKLLLNNLFKFRKAASQSSLEYGEISECDKLILELSINEDSVFSQIVSYIACEVAGNVDYKAKLIKAIRLVEFKYPEKCYLATLVGNELSSASDEIKEAALHCFESWECKGLMGMLGEKKLTPAWIDDYRIEVLEYLNKP